MQTIATAIAAGLAASAGAQTLDLSFTVLNESLAAVDSTTLTAADAGTYFIVADIAFDAYYPTLAPNSPDHQFGLAAFVGGNADFTGGVSYGGNFLAGSSFGTPGAAGNAIFDTTDSDWLVAGPNVLTWNANSAFSATLAVFQVNFDGTAGTFDVSNFGIEFGLFRGSETPFGITIDTTSGTAYNDEDLSVTIGGPVRFVPAPGAAAGFAVAGLAAARRRR